MRIGLLTQWYDPEPGPAALPGALARGLVARGHDVQVVTGFPNYPTGRIAPGYRQSRRLDEVLDGVRVRRVALYANHDASTARRILNYASFAVSATVSGLDALADIDVLWVNYSPVSIGLAMFVQQWRRGTPAVVHALDLWPDTLFASGFAGEGGVGRAARSGLDRWCSKMYRQAAAVAYISPGVGEVLAERGVPRDQLVYAPMWADESVFRPVASPVDRSRWGLDERAVALVYAGTLGNAQDLTTFIRAITRLNDPRLQCLVAGSGTEEVALRALAGEAGDRIRFLGRLDKEDMADLMRASDIHYVGLNSHPLARVTMPSKVQAILASQRAIVGSLEGDAADVVRRAGGWATPPGDLPALESAILEAVGTGRPGLLERGRMARSVYEAEFSYDVGVDRVEQALLEAAGVRR